MTARQPARYFTHGVSGYTHYKCRCSRCRAANAVRTAGQVARRADQITADPSLAVHGKYTTYNNWHCRCDPCVEAHKQKCRDDYLARKARTS